jgi:tRNA threonylcarbamoyl adenosine modification protein (Sua5/YciO/YrdC/YwlC family)
LAELFQVHPRDPQPRSIQRAAEIMRGGGVIVYPTDSCYALGCRLGARESMERIRRIRNADRHHHFTLVCRDLSEIARYARVDNSQYRLLRKYTPGAYTFLLQATRETPKRLQNPRRRTIGIRVPDHPVPRALLAELGEPIMSSTLILPGDELPLSEGEDIRSRLDHLVDVVLDAGGCGVEPTTVIDLATPSPTIVRRGRGDPRPFES